MRIFRGVILAACAAAACGGKQSKQETTPAPIENRTTSEAPPPAAQGMSVDEAGQKALALMEKVRDAVISAGGDCAKMGADLELLTGEVKALMEAGKDLDKDEAKKKELDAKYGDALRKQVAGWIPELKKCKDDPGVRAFFESMD